MPNMMDHMLWAIAMILEMPTKPVHTDEEGFRAFTDASVDLYFDQEPQDWFQISKTKLMGYPMMSIRIGPITIMKVVKY